MLIALAILLLSIAGLLAIPVIVTFQVAVGQAVQKDIRLSWAFGLVNAQITPDESGAGPPKREKKKPRRRRPKPSSRKGRNVFAVIRQQRFRQRVVRFIGDVWRAIRKRDLRLRARIGLGDPADTGQLWALVGPMAGLLASAQGASIRIEPDFLDATFELDSSGTVQVIPLQLLYLAVALLLSPTLWRALAQIRRGSP